MINMFEYCISMKIKEGGTRLRNSSILLATVLLVSLASGCVVFVSPPTIATFDAVPQTINAGDSAVLVWATTDADNVVIDPGVGPVPSAGSRQVKPNSTTTYTMTATGRSGSITKTVVITVNPGVAITSFTSNQPIIAQGGSATLQWNVTGATLVSLDQGIGIVASSGSRTVSPSATTTYTMTAIGGTKVVTASTSVTVNSPPVIAQFTASPGQIALGATSRLSWDVRGSTRVSIEPSIGVVPASGSRTIQPSNTTNYILTAESDCCIVNKLVTVSVAQLPPPAFLPVVHLFNISPNSIYKGNSAVLSWQVTGTDKVVISQGIGEVAPSGTVTVLPQTSTIYTLTAYNQYGSRSVAISIGVFEP
jgi:hypothetical protein